MAGFSFVSFRWPIGGGVYLLELPPGFIWGDGYSYAECSSYDGQIIFGRHSVDGDTERPCMWVNGVLTELTSSTFDTEYTLIIACSSNGNVALGTVGGTSYGDLVRWTTPTNGTKLPPLPGDTGTDNDVKYDTAGFAMSADGSVVVGYSSPSNTNTVWTNGVAASWGVAATTSHGIRMAIVSANGSTIAGSAVGNNASSLGFWRSNTFYALKGAGGLGTATAYGMLHGISADGTRIYGSTNDVYGVLRECYWDDLTSVTGSYNWPSGPAGVANLYGTPHMLSSPGSASIYAACPGNANVVGGINYGALSFPTRWTNGVYTNLAPIPNLGGASPGRVMSISGDGTLAGGQSLQNNAAYWDASNVLHNLPAMPGAITWSSGAASGVSYNGTVFYGGVNYEPGSTSLVWQIAGSPKGAIGDFWCDPSYVSFDNPTTRLGFINANNSWKTLGPYGELPTGTSPICFLTCQNSLDPYDFTVAYGQDYGQSSWSEQIDGINPSTGLAYVYVFDECAVVILVDSELVFHTTFVDLSNVANRRKFVSSDGTPQWLEADGSKPFNASPAVYLTTLQPPLDFTQNNGISGSFPINGDITGADGPGCSTYSILASAGPLSDPQWRLNVSDDGGRTWGREIKPRAIGPTGIYPTRLRWLKMGQSRERIIKLECTDPVRRTILGVYIDLDQGMD